MRRGHWAVGSATAVGLAAALFGPDLLRRDIEVAPGTSLQAAIDAAPAGARLVVTSGTYDGPVTVDRPLELTGEPGARIVAPEGTDAALSIAASGVVVDGISTSGGDTGIRVREVERVQLEDVSVTRAEFHGIEVIDAHAVISHANVSGLGHELAQGIEIRNADGRPDTVVQDSTVSGGMEGIVSHVSEVIVRRNDVRETTLRAITITEMSDGIVSDNAIHDVAGAGLYCGDMSRCEFSSNTVSRVAATPLGRSTEGWGLVVTYHAAASSSGDRLDGDAGSIFTSVGGHVRPRTPLEIGAGAGAFRPVAVTVGVTLLALAALMTATRPAAAAIGRRAGSRSNAARWVVPVAVAGIAVQTFHMIEHALQVYRVRVDGVPSRGGLAGPSVEAEWVHFIYNALVLTGLAAVVAARARGWTPPGRRGVGDRLLVVAAAVQGYHVIEHSVKLGQHLIGGAKVNPGIAGQQIDLVLLHFGINLAVYLGCLGAAAAYVVSRTSAAPAAVGRYSASSG